MTRVMPLLFFSV